MVSYIVSPFLAATLETNSTHSVHPTGVRNRAGKTPLPHLASDLLDVELKYDIGRLDTRYRGGRRGKGPSGGGGGAEDGSGTGEGG